MEKCLKCRDLTEHVYVHLGERGRQRFSGYVREELIARSSCQVREGATLRMSSQRDVKVGGGGRQRTDYDNVRELLIVRSSSQVREGLMLRSSS